jgi:hypothetical protein
MLVSYYRTTGGGRDRPAHTPHDQRASMTVDIDENIPDEHPVEPHEVEPCCPEPGPPRSRAPHGTTHDPGHTSNNQQQGEFT